jgi:hypothetical protein
MLIEPALVKDTNAMQLQAKGRKFSMRTGTLLAIMLPLFCNVGCFSPVALSTMETTGNEAPVVFEHFGRGQGEGFFLAKYADVNAATLRAAHALSLEGKDRKVDRNQAFFRFYDAMNDRVDIFIVRRSDTVTSIRYAVGWFGSVGFGRLVFRQIISELHRS